MDHQYNTISRSLDVFRHLNSLAIAGSEEFFTWQLDQAQALVTRRTKQLKASWSEAKAADNLQWPEALQSGMRNAMEMAQECVAAATDYQMETLKLMQKQATQAQKVITESLKTANGNGDWTDQGAKQAARGGKLVS